MASRSRYCVRRHSLGRCSLGIVRARKVNLTVLNVEVHLASVRCLRYHQIELWRRSSRRDVLAVKGFVGVFKVCGGVVDLLPLLVLWTSEWPPLIQALRLSGLAVNLVSYIYLFLRLMRLVVRLLYEVVGLELHACSLRYEVALLPRGRVGQDGISHLLTEIMLGSLHLILLFPLVIDEHH